MYTILKDNELRNQFEMAERYYDSWILVNVTNMGKGSDGVSGYAVAKAKTRARLQPAFDIIRDEKGGDIRLTAIRGMVIILREVGYNKQEINYMVSEHKRTGKSFMEIARDSDKLLNDRRKENV